MAEDFVELGIEGIDKIVDKHFDKVPDSALHAHTYHPKNLTKSARRRNSTKNQERSKPRPTSESDSDEDTRKHRRSKHHSPRRRRTKSESDEEWERNNPRRDMHNTPNPSFSPSVAPASLYSLPPQYSHEPPRLRTQYLPQEYVQEPTRSRREDERYYSDSHHAPRRPRPITRRSSSYHGPHRRSSSSSSSDSSSDHGRKRPSHTEIIKGRSSASHTDVIKDRSHRYGLKDETLGRFTKSPAGVTGSVVGGAIGAWAANQAQVMIGRDQKKDKKRDQAGNKALSILGAAVGAMAVNAAMNKWEEGKKGDHKREDKAWEEKWGTDDEDYGGGRSAGGRMGSRDSRRKDSEGGRRRDRDYVGERDGRGYTPYGDPRDRH